MLSRRDTLALALAAAAGKSNAATRLTDDGLHTEDWFVQSLLELGDDFRDAIGRNKQLVVLWELKGCPYCRDMHIINFARTDISNYIKERFDVVQLNIIGSREVVDFDGEKLSEKRFAAKYGVRTTPTLQFFGTDESRLRNTAPTTREVFRSEGYVKPDEFLRRFAYVADKAYERESLVNYLRRQPS